MSISRGALKHDTLGCGTEELSTDCKIRQGLFFLKEIFWFSQAFMQEQLAGLL